VNVGILKKITSFFDPLLVSQWCRRTMAQLKTFCPVISLLFEHIRITNALARKALWQRSLATHSPLKTCILGLHNHLPGKTALSPESYSDKGLYNHPFIIELIKSMCIDMRPLEGKRGNLTKKMSLLAI
jgi:hypothetical protein